MKYDIHSDTNNLKEELYQIKLDLRVLDTEKKVLKYKIFQYFAQHSELSSEFESELNFLKKNNVQVFPYRQLKVLDYVQSGYDSDLALPYVVHNNRRLYFPKFWTEEEAALTYRNFIENENILGGGYREKAPHQYETEDFCVKDGDVLLDIGAAEGLFALHVIDKAKKVYLIESDEIWIEALNATFESYKDKVVIINKLISDTDTDETITLSSLLENELNSSVFLKMDIEGYEAVVLNASKDILSQNLGIRIACCVYHKQTAAEELEKLFTSMGYQTEFSEGYMLFILDNLKPPYFRKGMIRTKIKQ